MCFIKKQLSEVLQESYNFNMQILNGNLCLQDMGEGPIYSKNSQKMVTIFSLKKHSKFQILSANGKVWAP